MTFDPSPETYDSEAHARPAVTVDLVLLGVFEGCLCALLQRRGDNPFAGKWALPGGFVGIDESLDEAARRILADKAHMREAFLEQLYTFGDPARDPRMRIITVAHYALLPAREFEASLAASPELALAELSVPWEGEAGGPVGACDSDGNGMALAFDHSDILGWAVKRLRGKLDYAPIAFELLPELFTLRALQEVHEAILGRRMGKPAFRRRMLDKGWIAGTGKLESGTAFRPAELYRHKTPKGD